MKTINKKDLMIYAIITVLTCIIFLPFLVGHYSSDSYNIYNIGYYDYAIEYSLNDGRIFMAIFGLIANKINISIELYIFITLFISLLISNVSVMLLNNIIKKFKKPQNFFQEIIVIIISYITIFNFMYLENMYFVECIIMSISTLLFLLSANILVEKKNKYFIKSLILTLLGVLFYQGTIGMFFTFVILFTILKNKNDTKQIIIDLIKSGIIAGIAILTELLFMKIISIILDMDQTRIASLSKIPDNLSYIISWLPNLIHKTCDLFPQYMFFIFLIILTIIVVTYQFKKISNEDIIFKYLSIIFITIASGCAVSLLAITSIYAGRTKNCIGALIGVLFIFIYVMTDIFQNKGKLNKVTIATLLIFSIINIVNYERIILIHKNINKLENQEGQELENYILQYENQTGITVNKIMKVHIYHDIDKAYFTGTKNKSIFAHNAMRCYWSADGFVNFYTKRNMETIDRNKEIMEKYEKNHDEQRGYGIIGDVLYINTYLV